MRRIVVLGCAGSGKTAFARRLGQATGLPIIDLDQIWDELQPPGDVEAFRAIMGEVHAGEGWVSDGNFARATFDLRLPRTDLLVWLERPRWLCAWRAVRRVLRPGERHRLGDLIKVLRFIASFDRRNRPMIEEERLRHSPAVTVARLRTDGEIDEFIRKATAGEGDKPPLVSVWRRP